MEKLVPVEPHEFLSPLQTLYRECEYCGERKSMVCLKCGYCYECHPAIEALERRASILEKMQFAA